MMEPKFNLRFDKPYIIYRCDTRDNEGFFPIGEYLQCFGKTPGYHAIHYASSGFEGILGIVSDTKPNVINVLTLEQNAKRMEHTMQVFSIIASENDKRLAAIRQQIAMEQPELPISNPSVPVYMEFDPQHFVNDVIPEAVDRNYGSGALNLDNTEGNKRVYFRPVASKGEKFILSSPEDSVLTMGLGVGSLQHEGVLEMIVNNVPPYLQRKGNGTPPTAIVLEKELVDGLLPQVAVDDPIRKIKAAANYALGGVGNGVAARLGFTEALVQDTEGNILEGCGENIYLIKGNTLYTPSLDQSILPGTKREVVLTIARILGKTANIHVVEGPIKVDDLFSADAIAFSGTWTGFEPIYGIYRHSDRRQWISSGPNHVLEAIKQVYDNIIYDRQVRGTQLEELKQKVLTPIEFGNKNNTVYVTTGMLATNR